MVVWDYEVDAVLLTSSDGAANTNCYRACIPIRPMLTSKQNQDIYRATLEEDRKFQRYLETLPPEHRAYADYLYQEGCLVDAIERRIQQGVPDDEIPDAFKTGTSQSRQAVEEPPAPIAPRTSDTHL